MYMWYEIIIKKVDLNQKSTYKVKKKINKKMKYPTIHGAGMSNLIHSGEATEKYKQKKSIIVLLRPTIVCLLSS